MTILRIPNSGGDVRIACARHAVRLQHAQRYLARIVLSPASVVEKYKAWFLAERNDKFSRRATAVRSRDHHSVAV